MASHKDNRFHTIRLAFEKHHKKIVRDLKRRHKRTFQSLKQKGLSLAGTAIIASTILASSPSEVKDPKDIGEDTEQISDLNELVKRIKDILSKDKASLTQGDEEQLAKLLSKYLRLKLKVTLDGNRLNEIYGYIGAEQHLFRWSGDNLASHDLRESGIAPLKGSFGFFDNENQEKYYVAVQLHELPDWNEDWPVLKPWYRYRKVLVYNPDNGRSVIAVIGDSGPAKFTGKTFGGSPEVMKYLERVDGAQKGRVIILFIDDPDNKIALGPVSSEQALALKTE